MSRAATFSQRRLPGGGGLSAEDEKLKLWRKREGKQMSILGELLKKSYSKRTALGSVQEPYVFDFGGPTTPYGKRSPGGSSPNIFLGYFP